jgi:ABC-type Fe3+-hydroxamate transport system substrate-binding protein
MKYRRTRILLLSVPLFASAAPASLHLTDDLGRAVDLSAPAQRIVSLAPSLTESLFAIGAGEQVVGRTAFCDYPAGALRVSSVGGMTNPSMESIVACRPDLILVSMEGNTRDDFPHLLSLGVPVYVSNPRTLDGIYHSLDHLGLLTGRHDQARHLIDSLQRQERELRREAPAHPRSVMIVISLQPLMVAGGNTLMNELLTLAGARNPAAAFPGHYPAISREAVLADPPDVLILTSDLPARPAELITLFPEWKYLRSVRQGHIYSIDAAILSRPGPRALEGLRLIIDTLSRGTP